VAGGQELGRRLSFFDKLSLPRGLNSSGFHTQILCAYPFSPYVPHAQPISPSSINHSDNIQIAVQIVKRRTVRLSPVSCHFLILTPKHLHQSLFWNTVSLCSSLTAMTDQVPHPYTAAAAAADDYSTVCVDVGILRLRNEDIIFWSERCWHARPNFDVFSLFVPAVSITK